MEQPVTMQELVISSLAESDAIAELLMEKGLVTRDEILEKVAARRAIYQRMLNPTQQ